MNKCKIHNNLITHICCSSGCFSFLCGKCVVEHLNFHKSQATWPELFTLEEMKTLCKSKLELALKNSASLINETEEKQLQEQALQNKINEEFLYLFKKKLLSLLDEYFASLNIYTNQECEKISVKLVQNLENLKKARDKLTIDYEHIENTQNYTELVTIFQSDYNKLLGNYQECFNDLLKEKFLIAFKESKMEVFKKKLFDLANEILFDRFEANTIDNNSNENNNSIDNSPKFNNKSQTVKKSFETPNPKPNDSQKSLTKPETKTENCENSPKNEKKDHFPANKSKEKEKVSKSLQSANELKNDEKSKSVSQKSIKSSIDSKNNAKNPTKTTNIAPEEIPEQRNKKNNPPEEPEKPLSQKQISQISNNDIIRINEENTTEELKQSTSNDPRASKSSLKTANTQKNFEITAADYFIPNKDVKNLHFFEENSKNLYLLDIEKIADPLSTFEKTVLQIDFTIPSKSRSIITPEGLIYLLGGYYNKSSSNTYLYDHINQTLQPKASMNDDREGFGVTYVLNQIYVCGGNNEYGNKLASCERYDLYSNTWTKIAALNQKVSGLYVCSYNEKLIYKFGGESTQTLLSQIIEIYDIKNNKWNVIQAVTESNLVPVISRLGACVQINEKNIFIFGGYYAKNDAGTNQSFLLENSDKKFVIKNLNEKLLPFCAGFWCNMPIIHKKQIICMQNVTDPDNKSLSLPDKRRILLFDSCEWKKIK